MNAFAGKDGFARNEGVTSAWYLAQLKPGGHARARTNLERQGFGTFLPMQRVTRRRASRLLEALSPLFPGYIFVEVGRSAAPWRTINSTFGVARLVRFDTAGPAEVPMTLVEALRCHCDGEIWQPDVSILRPGDSVRILNGPFADCLATIDQIRANDRVFVLIEMMGQAVRAEVAPDHLTRIG